MGMTPYYADRWLTVHLGDARSVMAEMEPESVHCVVTSPPYWGLRDYGTATWVGGDEACDHTKDRSGGITSSGLEGGKATTNHQHEASYRVMCGKCGAIRQDGQLGLEPTPEAYVASMVDVFREVRRVLRSDGTVWLNLGDSYAQTTVRHRAGAGEGGPRGPEWIDNARSTAVSGLKAKDLVGIPWRVAFALQADGWYLRSDIIWSKPNPMPESVTDRPTKSHEYLFLLAKSPRYYYDADAIAEAAIHAGETVDQTNAKTNGRAGTVNDYRTRIARAVTVGATRNRRTVWTVATQPYPGAHFATFPQKLVEPCIKAGTSERGVCPECGAPWEREVEREGPSSRDWQTLRGQGTKGADAKMGNQGKSIAGARPPDPTRSTTGWRPGCSHGMASVPATVLDPFAGSGTSGLVAQRLSRRAVLIDLSLDYLGQLMDRNRDIPLGLGA